MKHGHSDYMQWAKLHSRARYNLATSGVGAFPLTELSVSIEQLEINGDSTYGYAPLQKAIAQKCGVTPDCIVAAAGTSMANHLAMSALLEPGDEVLIEHPSYELIVSAALYFGAAVKRFPRLEEHGYAIDPSLVRQAITSKTKLIIVTNLHNPSSVLTPESVLKEVGEIASNVGARVLVDEVYLDAVYDNMPRSAFHLGPEFVVTNSLTKVYGLSGLRCGWILAQPDLASRMWRLNDLFGSIPAHPAELLSVIAFQQLDKIRQRSRVIVEADRRILTKFLDEHVPRNLSVIRTQFGTTCFVGLKKANADEFVTQLRAEHETSIVPGRFFEMPNHIRIGMGVNSEMFAEGLRRVSLALNCLAAKAG